MTIADDVYTRLARYLNVYDAPSFNPVLETLITPEEGIIFMELSQPVTCEQLAARLNLDREKLQAQLTALVDRGWLRLTENGYTAPRLNPRFLPGLTLPGVAIEKSQEAWKNFFYQDWHRILVESKERILATRGFNQWRVAPAGMGLAASPNIQPEFILPYEDVRNIVRRATDITVHNCGCREVHKQCDHPLKTCICAVWEGKIDTSGDYTGGHEVRIHISAEKAIELLNGAEESGLIHLVLNASQMAGAITIHSCCPCCCYLLYPVMQQRKVHKLISPSRYRAAIDEQRCNGCRECLERCHFDAIEMRQPASTEKPKAFIIDEHCMGCGLCNFKCPRGAMRLELVRPPVHIPIASMREVSSLS